MEKRLNKRRGRSDMKETRGEMRLLKKLSLEKRGMSHIEMILSFVIFVGFLIFLIAIFNPFKYFGGGDVYLDTVERGIREETSVEVIFQTLKLNKSISEECFWFKSDLENVIVKDENYNIVEAMSGNEIYINSKEKFFYMSSCEEFVEKEFTPGKSGCEEIKEGDYILGLFRSYDFTSNKKLKELHSDSIKNYEKVKGNIGLPASKDFAFSLRGTVVGEELMLNMTKIPGKGAKVFGRDVPVQLVYTDGEIKYAILNIQVW